MRVYFVRHGESEANLQRVFANRQSKHRLTDKGRKQALTVAQKLKGISVARLFSSPLIRAMETAAILGEELAVSYDTTEALREYDCGVLEGKSDAASWEVYYAVLNDWMENEHWERRFEDGESFLDMKERFVPFIEQLLETYGHLAEDIVLVGHGGLYRCMLPLVLDNIDFEFSMAHSLSNTGVVVAEKGAEGLVCLEWCRSIA